MTRRIILLSDGTGHGAASIWRTNIWRIFQAIDLADTDGAEQIASYDDGIGTSAFKPLAWFGGIFGYGLKRNVIDNYKFLCRNYVRPNDPVEQPKPEIFAFGFSRGAFTIRVILELLMSEGIVPYNGNEQDLHRAANAAYRSFRKKRGGALFERVVHALSSLLGRDYDGRANFPPPAIKFVGLWDTVSAYGLPIAEMTKFFSLVVWSFDLAGTRLDKRVLRACHAISLDEERTTFRPLLWTEAGEASPSPAPDGFRYTGDERISQVWFAGVHSNVGGGYPDDALAHIPLRWMMKEASDCGLSFKAEPNPFSMRQLCSIADKDGRLYNSRSGLAVSYRYGPRKLSELCNARSASDYGSVEIDTPKIHHTVFERMLTGAFPYAPLGLPAKYDVVTAEGRIQEGQNAYETLEQAKGREIRQEIVWNRVFLRSTIYVTTFAAAAALVLYPFFHHAPLPPESTSALVWVSDIVRLAGNLTFGVFDFWVKLYARAPEVFLVGIILLVVSQHFGRLLKDNISDEIRSVWRLSLSGQPFEPEKTFIYGIRTNRIFLFVRDLLWNDIAPVATMSVVAVFLLGFALHMIFYMTDATGFYCRNSVPGSLKTLRHNEETTFRFRPADICSRSGIAFEEGGSYEITIKPQDNLNFDGRVGLNSVPALQRFGSLSPVIYDLAWPTRRTLQRPWFTVIGRVGRVGANEFFFDPAPGNQETLHEILRAHYSDELFLYVNDMAIPFLGLSDVFYHNRGTADVVVKRID